MQRPPLILRAFQLAGSGKVSSTEELERVLRREGYSDLRVSLGGRATKTQLRAKIEEARAAVGNQDTDDEGPTAA